MGTRESTLKEFYSQNLDFMVNLRSVYREEFREMEEINRKITRLVLKVEPHLDMEDLSLVTVKRIVVAMLDFDTDRYEFLYNAIRSLTKYIKLVTSDLDYIDTETIKSGSLIRLMDELNIRKHNNYIICPIHNEKTPSCRVYEDHVYCYGCGWNTDIIGFVMEHQKLSFKEAINFLTTLNI